MVRPNQALTPTGPGKMPPLNNDRREKYCHAFVRTGKQEASAIEAGYSPNTARNTASRLMRSSEVVNRIREIRGITTERVVARIEQHLDLDTVISDLSAIAITGMSNFLTIREDGETFIDLTKATQEQLDCLQEVTCEVVLEKDGDEVQRVRKIKVKGYDRLKTYDMLMKHLGGYLVDRAKANESSAFGEFLREISRRGSRPPIVEKEGG